MEIILGNLKTSLYQVGDKVEINFNLKKSILYSTTELYDLIKLIEKNFTIVSNHYESKKSNEFVKHIDFSELYLNPI